MLLGGLNFGEKLGPVFLLEILEDRGKQMEFEIWSSIIQVFLKGDSMEILKSAWNLCQSDRRIC